MAAEALVGVHSLGVGWGGGRAAGSGAEPERAAGCGMGTVRDAGCGVRGSPWRQRVWTVRERGRLGCVPAGRVSASYAKFRRGTTENETCVKCNWRLHVVHKNEPDVGDLIFAIKDPCLGFISPCHHSAAAPPGSALVPLLPLPCTGIAIVTCICRAQHSPQPN